MTRTSEFGNILCLLTILLARARAAILTSKFTRITQNISNDVTAIPLKKPFPVLSVYCGSHGCQIRFGNDLVMRQLSTNSFNCSGNDETACGVEFPRAQQALKILLAKRDSLYLSRWLNLNFEMKSTMPDAQGKKIASNRIRYQKLRFNFST